MEYLQPFKMKLKKHSPETLGKNNQDAEVPYNVPARNRSK